MDGTERTWSFSVPGPRGDRGRENVGLISTTKGYTGTKVKDPGHPCLPGVKSYQSELPKSCNTTTFSLCKSHFYVKVKVECNKS